MTLYFFPESLCLWFNKTLCFLLFKMKMCVNQVLFQIVWYMKPQINVNNAKVIISWISMVVNALPIQSIKLKIVNIIVLIINVLLVNKVSIENRLQNALPMILPFKIVPFSQSLQLQLIVLNAKLDFMKSQTIFVNQESIIQ